MRPARTSPRIGSLKFSLIGVAILALVLAAGGCESPAPGSAAVEYAACQCRSWSRKVTDRDVLQLTGAQVPGLTVAEVQSVELPGVLETNGHVAFDDQRVSTIVSRVAGRIEATRVSQWDNVRRGEPIISLYSPDFMTAEAEYLQAQTTAQLSSTPALASSMGTSAVRSPENLAAAMLSAARRKLELLGMDEADIDAISAPSPTVWMRAPISGTVVDNKAVRGAAVNPGDVLLHGRHARSTSGSSPISMKMISRASTWGNRSKRSRRPIPMRSSTGFVSRISPDVDPDTHTLQIRCQVENPRDQLKPADARARAHRRPTPATRWWCRWSRWFSIPTPTTSMSIWAAEHYDRRKVEIGSWKEQGPARVLAGLTAGERVVAGESIQINALWHQANGESS